MAGSSLPADAASRQAPFGSTEWSVVLEARRDSDRRRESLERLCSTYWRPIYAYLRRRGHPPADAEDLTQSFFCHLLESDFLDRPDPEKGRFRGYLVGALRHFLSTHFEKMNAAKRGGGARWVDWSTAEAEAEFAALGASPRDASELYETTWALALLGQALRRLEAEQVGEEKRRRFSVLKPFLAAAPSKGDYEAAALALGTTRTNVAVWVHRLSQRYGEWVKLEVAATVRDPADVRQELAHLLAALGR